MAESLAVDISSARQCHLNQQRPRNPRNGGKGKNKDVDAAPISPLANQILDICGNEVVFGPFGDNHDQVDRFVQVTFFRPGRLEKQDILDWETGHQRGNALVYVGLGHTHGLRRRGYQDSAPRSTRCR